MQKRIQIILYVAMYQILIGHVNQHLKYLLVTLADIISGGQVTRTYTLAIRQL